MRTQETAQTEWKTLGLMIGCYGSWIICLFLWNTVIWPVAIIALPVIAAFHTSLQHEAIHGHPTRWQVLNELIVSIPIAVVFPFRRYRDLHLQHHRDEHLTDPFEDPESYFWAEADVQSRSSAWKTIFAFNNTLIGRLLIGPALTIVGFSRTEFNRILNNEDGVRIAWGLHTVGLVFVILTLTAFNVPLWAYALFVVYPALSLTALRAYAEHQAAEAVGARSAVVEAHPFWSLLYLNNNLHIVHHASPATPWYDLPALYRERRQIFLTANENTLFNGYSDILKRFAFRIKQPVEHPILYRSKP